MINTDSSFEMMMTVDLRIIRLRREENTESQITRIATDGSLWMKMLKTGLPPSVEERQTHRLRGLTLIVL